MNKLFSELPILEETKKAIVSLNFNETTDIQSKAIEPLIEGVDLIGQAQTGTGKTFAFAIPMIEKIDVNQAAVQGLIICPTRELTLQVYTEIKKLIKFNPKIRLTVIYGGESYTKQFQELRKNPHIVVATPGRTIDHLERKTIHFNDLKMLVLDEADEMLKMGFQEDLETILKDTPATRQTALFSATIPAFIKKIAKTYLKNPVMIKIESKTMTVSKIKQLYYHIKKADREALMVRLLDFHQPLSAIVFANTKKDVDDLTVFLQKNEYLAEALHGDLKQNQRDYVMNKFRYKQIQILVATDVAARGLDIPHVDFVFNYDLPFDDEVYVHRIGRTGRAGKTGISISLVYPSMKNKLAQIEKFINQTMTETTIPTIEEIHGKNMGQFIKSLDETIVSNETTHQDILAHFHDQAYDPYQIIEGLLTLVKPKTKSYPQIEIPQKKKTSQQPLQNANQKKKHQNYFSATINLGKKDGIRAALLVDYLKKHADLYPKNIGDIVISDKDTVFEIHVAAVKRLDTLKDKFYNGKKIKVVIKRS